jgi:hypothetical protein
MVGSALILQGIKKGGKIILITRRSQVQILAPLP